MHTSRSCCAFSESKAGLPHCLTNRAAPEAGAPGANKTVLLSLAQELVHLRANHLTYGRQEKHALHRATFMEEVYSLLTERLLHLAEATPPSTVRYGLRPCVVPVLVPYLAAATALLAPFSLLVLSHSKGEVPVYVLLVVLNTLWLRRTRWVVSAHQSRSGLLVRYLRSSARKFVCPGGP